MTLSGFILTIGWSHVGTSYRALESLSISEFFGTDCCTDVVTTPNGPRSGGRRGSGVSAS